MRSEIIQHNIYNDTFIVKYYRVLIIINQDFFSEIKTY